MKMQKKKSTPCYSNTSLVLLLTELLSLQCEIMLIMVGSLSRSMRNNKYVISTAIEIWYISCHILFYLIIRTAPRALCHKKTKNKKTIMKTDVWRDERVDVTRSAKVVRPCTYTAPLHSPRLRPSTKNKTNDITSSSFLLLKIKRKTDFTERVLLLYTSVSHSGWNKLFKIWNTFRGHMIKCLLTEFESSLLDRTRLVNKSQWDCRTINPGESFTLSLFWFSSRASEMGRSHLKKSK